MGRAARAEPLTHPVGQGSSGAEPGSDWMNPHSRPKEEKKKKEAIFFSSEKQQSTSWRWGCLERADRQRILRLKTNMDKENVNHSFARVCHRCVKFSTCISLCQTLHMSHTHIKHSQERGSTLCIQVYTCHSRYSTRAMQKSSIREKWVVLNGHTQMCFPNYICFCFFLSSPRSRDLYHISKSFCGSKELSGQSNAVNPVAS